MPKYNISREFFPYSLLTPPLGTDKISPLANRLLKNPPRRFFSDPDVAVRRTHCPGHGGDSIEVFVLTPHGIGDNAPCLVYFHGGGFVYDAAPYHYTLALEYAKRAYCRVVFVRYRLAPKYTFPTPAEDCYEVLCRIYSDAKSGRSRSVDFNRIAVGGDSAGGALAAAVCLMARDRLDWVPCFQMLVYPVCGLGLTGGSMQEYTDTPMWNSKLNRAMWEIYLKSSSDAGYSVPLEYAAPLESADLSGLPPAYIETAEFDCLRDEALIYGERLKEADVPVTINRTRGTMHGYDIVDCTTSQIAVATRAFFMQEHFYM